MIQTTPVGPPAMHIAASPQQLLPIPRGYVLQAQTAAAAKAASKFVQAWRVSDPNSTKAATPRIVGLAPIDGLEGWYELRPSRLPKQQSTDNGSGGSGIAIRNLVDFWTVLQSLRASPGITAVHPLLCIVNPQPATQIDAEAFSMGAGQHHFGGWGAAYDRTTDAKIQKCSEKHDWHLDQLKAPAAHAIWKRAFPSQPPASGTRIALLDTGCTSHPRVENAFETSGRSFVLRHNLAQAEASARDDLHMDDRAFVQFPGHGTAVASAIVDVAPGARLIPLRVSRSTQTFDFHAVGSAILSAAADGAHVISLSLGSPIYSDYVHECIRQAQRAGVIVVATAGNALPMTSFPGALPDVVGVAATHRALGPWRFSGCGRFVDVAAPGEQVWCARASLKKRKPDYRVAQASSTGIATGLVAGLAAMWLAYHGGRDALADKYGGRCELIPLAFKSVLVRSADAEKWLASAGRYGVGIADAEKLLHTRLPSRAQIERYAEVVREHVLPRLAFAADGLAAGTDGILSAIAPLDWAASVGPSGRVYSNPVAETEAAHEVRGELAQETRVLSSLLGSQADVLGEEVLACVASDRSALVMFRRAQQNQNALPLVERLLGASGPYVSRPAQNALKNARAQLAAAASRFGSGNLTPPVRTVYPEGSAASQPLAPAFRKLRVYAFDPSLDTKLETAPITQVTIRTPWEAVKPGPIGEYLEVIDVDPASGSVYAPIDLDHPHVLAQDGHPPSEGDPHFHQQMVYAVSMNTIQHFERALGRPIIWSPLRPWLEEAPQEQHYFTDESLDLMGYSCNVWMARADWKRERYVQRLRVYPHALRESNAYYSPAKRALLFGYFPAAAVDTGTHYPGGMVFTCLSHDIVAHETTHAILDGMHPYFNEPSNEDVLAFHEAFADIVALLQHFTYADVLRHQIANTSVDLEMDNLLAQLAQQFGQATGRRGALRNALGERDDQGNWKRRKPDPHQLRDLHEPHERGRILIAAVFNAFLDLYHDRIADLLRIYTGGTGVLPAGRLHPDLINRLAVEASDIAARVLRTCIRAMDYMPPVDPTFGEFLRALITADCDLSPHEGRRNRIAFIDAFRSWGIYPPDVATLSEDSLRWQAPSPDHPLSHLDMTGIPVNAEATVPGQPGAAGLLDALEAWHSRFDTENPTVVKETPRPGGARADIFERSQEAQVQLHRTLKAMQANLPPDQSLIPGLDLRPDASFSVGNLRPARRIGSQGEYHTELIVEVVQTHRSDPPTGVPARGGATLVVDLRTWNVHYIIYKRLIDQLKSPSEPPALVNRVKRMQAAQLPAESDDLRSNFSTALAAMYTSPLAPLVSRIRPYQPERFALLHRGPEF
jgi:hypothetical protein